MGQIRVLPEHLANQIAAGEVVERPASALKELLENALDAGADDIMIELEAGGKRRITLTDNGRGMDRDDCLMAFERHATSKLGRAEDLFSIRTLGFRGEALPSIASVSKMTLESVTSESAGVRVRLHGNRILKVEDMAGVPGTRVSVENLFFNVPARRKFLRSTDTELGWMVSLVTQYALAFVDKRFRLEHNNRMIIDVPAVSSLKERVYQLFGKSMVEHLLPLEARVDWLGLRGLISTPDWMKRSRAQQYLFVNQRMVRDRVLSHAVASAYRGFGEKGQHPVIILFVDCPSGEVDVNVHPSKTEVKFIASGFVHDAVQETIGKVLKGRPLTPAYRFQGMPERGSALPQAEAKFFAETRSPAMGPRPLVRPLMASPSGTGDPLGSSLGMGSRDEAANPGVEGGQSVASCPNQPGLYPSLETPRVIGQFKDSFILAEDADSLMIIDQHVAHERLLFDKIKSSLEQGALQKQALLIPETIEVTPEQQVEMASLRPLIERFGFSLEPFDAHTYIVREVPIFFAKHPIPALVMDLIETLRGRKTQADVEDIAEHLAATRACRAAVKINMRLTMEKMEQLVSDLWCSASPMYCPHGRPIIVRITLRDLEKNFLRR